MNRINDINVSELPDDERGSEVKALGVESQDEPSGGDVLMRDIGDDELSQSPQFDGAAAETAGQDAPAPLSEAQKSAPTWSLFSTADLDELPAGAPQNSSPTFGQPAALDARERVTSEPKARFTPACDEPAPTYVPPSLGIVNPLATKPTGDLDVAANGTHGPCSLDKAQASDLGTSQEANSAGVSKVKLASAAALLVAALIIGWGWFAPSHVPAPVQTALPSPESAQPAQVPQTPAPTDGVTQPGTTVGIDVGNAQSIPLVQGDFDLIEQGTPIAPASQKCDLQGLSVYGQKLCSNSAMSAGKFFKCAPDGLHWDPRTPGCEAI